VFYLQSHYATEENLQGIMIKKSIYNICISAALLYLSQGLQAQPLGIKEALGTATANYESIKAKSSYVQASTARLAQARRSYAPNLVLSAQQDYGTVNGQNGPLYGFGGYGVASSGLPLPGQNWNAGFGALYLANFNWEFFSFGRVRGRIKIATGMLQTDSADLAQELFQHQVKVAAAYLNLLAAQRITRTQERNLERALVFKTMAVSRAGNGLIAGVDSSLAAAEVSNARIALIRAKDTEQEHASKLAVLMGIQATDFVLDTTFLSRVPVSVFSSVSFREQEHPLLRFLQSRTLLSNEQTRMLRRQYYPSFSLFAVMQGRGSGFEAGYTQDQTKFTRNYAAGITPTRANYLLGVGMNWNIMSVLQHESQVRAQKFVTEGLQHEYELARQQLLAQQALAEQKLRNAMDAYNEAPQQVRSAMDAYTQKNVMYSNGLTTIVDVTQAMYALTRAETDREIAYTNVWQALLMKAAATGDMGIFINEF